MTEVVGDMEAKVTGWSLWQTCIDVQTLVTMFEEVSHRGYY